MSCFGFIGTGNMGSSCARAVAMSCAGEKLFLSNKTRKKAQMLAEELGAKCGRNVDVAKNANFIFLGVKPQVLPELFEEIKPSLQKRADNFVLVSMAAGTEIERIQKLVGKNVPVIRIMPNTPVSVGKGVVLYTCSKEVSAASKAEFLKCMEDCGSLYELPEDKLDAASSLSGCGPAFVAIFLEALADGAVACGVSRELAYSLASQTLLGTAQLQIETGALPAALKDAVCSPAGTTIEGVRVLEKRGLRGGVIDALKASYEKGKTL